MRLGTLVLGLTAFTLCLLMAAPCSAYLLDEHFGVTLALDQDNAATDSFRNVETIPMLGSSYEPTRNTGTVDYTVDDWFGSWDDDTLSTRNDLGKTGQTPTGGEPYDVEAFYFDDDPGNLYFAVVTSFDPPPGRQETRSGYDQLIVGGDLALNLGLNSPYNNGFSYDYGVNINHENRPENGGNASSGGTALGQELYRTANSDWYLGSPDFSVAANGELTNFDPDYSGFSGTYLGDVTTNYYTYDFGGTDHETLYSTRVIEATIPRSYLPALGPGDTVDMSWVMGCRNDATDSTGIIRFEDPPDIDTPEPGTLVLIAVGGAALSALRRRRD